MEEYEAAKVDKRRGAGKQINGCSVRSDYQRRLVAAKPENPTSLTLHRVDYDQEKQSHIHVDEGEDEFGFRVGSSLDPEIRSQWEIVDLVRAKAKESQQDFQKNLLNPETDTLVVFIEHEEQKEETVSPALFNALCQPSSEEDETPIEEGKVKVKMTRKGRKAEVVSTSQEKKKEKRVKKEKKECQTYKGRIDFYQFEMKKEINANSSLRYNQRYYWCPCCRTTDPDPHVFGRENRRRELIEGAGLF